MVGELRNFWQLGKLGQVWGKYERNGEVCWDVGGKGRCENMRWGSLFGVWGEVWELCWGSRNVGEVGMQGNVGKSVGKCVRLWREVC